MKLTLKYKGVLVLTMLVVLGAGVLLSRTARAREISSAPETFSNTRSSGLFQIPANAKSVDWAILNNRADSRKVRVTVYRCPIGSPKVAISPGPLTVTIPGRSATHNANSVGPGKPFLPGFYYEVVVEDNDALAHPSVAIWQDFGGTVIPGTRIGPEGFVQSVN
jgi:hypothetical protein